MGRRKKKRKKLFEFPGRIKQIIWGIIMIVFALVVVLSFFGKAGAGGVYFMKGASFLIGSTVFLLPLILIIAGVTLLISKDEEENFLDKAAKSLWPVMIAVFLLLLGISGILGSYNVHNRSGGIVGYLLSWPFLRFLGFWATLIIFLGTIVVGGVIFSRYLGIFNRKKKEEDKPEEEKTSIIRKIFAPKFKIKQVPPFDKKKEPEEVPEPVKAEIKKTGKVFSYVPPSLSLLSSDKGMPNSGDTNINSAIIKKTFQNFGIDVTMSEINIGPTVTQYTLKPAEGIKLSKITGLSNDLALALAAHPIRIEAPIPGRSLVGIEVPNKGRAEVRLRNLIEADAFQKSPMNLVLSLGRDVAGFPIYADLTKMPHLLVAGATGTGKTCAADTFMFTEKGMLTFEELCPLSLKSEVDFKIKIVTRDGIEETAKNYNNGICSFFKLSTSRGYEVEATAEHPLWVINEDGSQSWKSASLIKPGDYVAISRGPTLFGNKIDLSDFKPSKIGRYHRKISFPSKMTPRLAQFLGFLTADGGLSMERKDLHRVVYTQASPYLIKLYKESLRELFGITKFMENRSGSNPNNKAKDITIGSKHLKEFLAYLGMDSSKSPQKEMPRAIREAPEEIVKAYLSAVFDNDGYIGRQEIELTISSKKLISQIHLMLLNFGIVSSLSIKKVKNYIQNDYFRLSIFGEDARKFIGKIGFARKEKNAKAEELLKLSPNPNRDLIPNISNLLKSMGKKYLDHFAVLTNRGWKYQSGILVPKHAFNSLRSYNSGFRMPGYQALDKILDFYQSLSGEPEYQELKNISERNFYWDKVEKVELTSGVGYDFYVPGSDSFVGNGFVNHNTIFLNSLIGSLLYQPSTSNKSAGPETLRLIMVDPKRVEFPVYEKLPHLLCPVIYSAQQTINALKWLTGEMERRFEVLAAAHARDISSFNAKALNKKEDPLPFIVVVIDELADLMAAKGREIEAGIVRLAQMARAVGIHLVVATQRPSVEVITGLIKANITSRITFQVASQVDSRTIIDTSGAEKLLGSGDMLYVSAATPKPKRIQGAYVSDKEIKKVVGHIQENSDDAISMDDELVNELDKGLEEGGVNFHGSLDKEPEEPLYEEAKRVVLESKRASASLLQRRLRVGYARAARLIDILEDKGVVGPASGSKPREVYGEAQTMQSSEGPETEDGWEKV